MQKMMAGPTHARLYFALCAPISQSRAFQRNISATGIISAISDQRAIRRGATVAGHGATLVGHGATIATIVAGHGMMFVVVELGHFMETTDRGELRTTSDYA